MFIVVFIVVVVMIEIGVRIVDGMNMGRDGRAAEDPGRGPRDTTSLIPGGNVGVNDIGAEGEEETGKSSGMARGCVFIGAGMV